MNCLLRAAGSNTPEEGNEVLDGLAAGGHTVIVGTLGHWQYGLHLGSPSAPTRLLGRRSWCWRPEATACPRLGAGSGAEEVLVVGGAPPARRWVFPAPHTNGLLGEMGG